MARNYSNTAVDTALSAGIGAGDLSLTVASATGWPSAPFAAVLDPGAATEEVVQVTVKAGTTWTVTRGFDGTTAAAHNSGVTVRHAAIAGDFTDLQAADTTNAGNLTTHAALTTSAHGGIVASNDSRLADARTPTGAAGGVLGGTYPNPSFAADMATQAELDAEASARVAADALLAPKASPTFTGTPAAPTAAPGTNTTQLATTAFVLANGAGVTDGDKGDITVSGSGATWTIDNDAVTYAKLQNVSATSRILGRATSGAGDVEELTGAQVLSITGAQTAIASGRGIIGGGNTLYSLPGVVCTAQGVAALAANQLRYLPIKVDTTITLDRIAIEVTTAGAAATTARLGIYNCDTNRQPTTLIVDAGTVATDSLGVKAITINQQLTPGLYLLALNNDGTPTLRYARGFIPTTDIADALGTALFAGNYRKTLAYAAFLSNGVAWDTLGGDTAPTQYNIFVRISTP